MEGSRELNRMKDEIRELPLILFGLVSKETELLFSNYEYSDYPLWKSEGYVWQLDVMNRRVVGVTLMHRGVLFFYHRFNEKQLVLDHEKTVKVHSLLPGLIAGMQKHFSTLGIRLKPLLVASKLSK